MKREVPKRVVTETNAEISARLERLEQENARLRGLVDDHANGVVRDWLVSADAFSSVVPDVHSTLSWRITRPLRQVRAVQLKVAEIGLAPTARIVVARVGKRIRRGSR